MNYPSSRQVTYTPDAAGRIASIGGSTAYWSGVQYAPQGAPTQVTLGNGLIERWGFNTARQQPSELKLGTSTNAVEKGQWQFRYCGGFGDASCSANSGNILGQMHTIGGANFNQTYHYDPLNRICSVRETASTTPLGPRNCGDVSGVIGGETWFQAYSVDRFGNLATPTDPNINVHPLTVRSLSDYDTDTNRLKTLSGIWNYDAAGNLTKHGGWTLAYDAENRQKTSQPSGGSVTTYDYDGDDRRVKKTTGATSTWFVYDASGQLAAEYTTAGPSGSGATHYLTTDHLGSTRLVTDASKNVISRHDYLPFGWEIYTGITSRTTAQGYSPSPSTLATPSQRFTGKERDQETGLDYFGARYFSSGQGRFTSADAPFADQKPDDPLSWNLYSYVRNNPQRYVDPSGRILETLWDAANIAVGVYSLIDNVSNGDYRDAALDAGGLVLDVAATALPLVPGGASTAIKASRAANKIDNAVDAAKPLDRVGDAADARKAVPDNPLGGGKNLGEPGGPKPGSAQGDPPGGRVRGKAREGVLEENSGSCVFCGKPADTVDHAESLKRGGNNSPANLQPACRSCNSSKRELNSEEFLRREAERRNQ